MKHAMRKRIERTKEQMMKDKNFSDVMLSPTAQHMKKAFLKKIEDRRRLEQERTKHDQELNRQAAQKGFDEAMLSPTGQGLKTAFLHKLKQQQQ